jgi:hypothetical protein
VKFRACALIAGCCSLGLLRAVAAADPPVDDGLLEFLGSVDSDDKDWRDYLAGGDTDPVARRVGTAPPAKPAVPPPAAGTPAVADPPASSAPPPVSYP